MCHKSHETVFLRYFVYFDLKKGNSKETIWKLIYDFVFATIVTKALYEAVWLPVDW